MTSENHTRLPEHSLQEMITQAAECLSRCLGGFIPEVGLILGSGLGSFADGIEAPIVVAFDEVPFMGVSTAAGHVGRFVCGYVNGKRVIAMQGRLHGYEGYSSQEVAFPVWVMASLGITALITTNAAGAINETYCVGDFCIFDDHINATGRNPLVGKEPDSFATRFVPMLDAYDPGLRALAREVAEELSIPIQSGVYIGLLGPSFETPAEIRAFRSWGADTVAMSVVEEVIAARHVGIKVLGISLISNMACGIEGSDPNDDEVREVGAKREEDFARLVGSIIKRM